MATRRDFLKTAAVGGALFGLGPGRTLLGKDSRRAALNSAKRARNVVFMVADGMNIGSLSAARHFQNMMLDQDNIWLSLYRTHPIVRCLMETSSANSLVTDSAAASSSWGCGQRINNGQINISATTGKPLEPICTTVQREGLATGLVTTATVTHATPAGFAANTPMRSNEALIARQYLERNIDVLLGGGTKFFSQDLLERYKKAGYGVITTRDELISLQPASANPSTAQSDQTGKNQQRKNTRPLLGLFADGHVPYTIDRNSSPELQQRVPTLAEMTQAALDKLSAAPDGFLLQVEGARVDHAGHANDAATLIHEQIAFDEAIACVRNYAAAHPDTLVVITTDHGTGGMNLNGLGVSYRDTNAAFEKLGGFTCSYGQMKKEAQALNTQQLHDYLVQATGISFSGDKLQALAAALQAVKAYSPDTMNDHAALGLGSLEAIFQTETAIGWTSHNHTGELVELAAFGPGSERFSPMIRNDEVHGLLLQALDIA